MRCVRRDERVAPSSRAYARDAHAFDCSSLSCLLLQLAFRRRIPCTVVDPRPLKCSSKQKRAMSSRSRSFNKPSFDPTTCKEKPSSRLVAWVNVGAVSPICCQVKISFACIHKEEVVTYRGIEKNPGHHFEMRNSGQVDRIDREAQSVSFAGRMAALDAPAAETPQLGVCDECKLGIEYREDIEVPPVAPSFAAAAAAESLPPMSICLPRQLCCLFDEKFPQNWSWLWQNCSLVVGMVS